MRLTVELVPATCWYSNVRSNVKPAEWDRLRRKVYAAAGYQCEACEKKDTILHAHEKWVYDDQTLIQRLDDMVALCPDCHSVKHIGHAYIQGRGDLARRHLASVNGWTQKQADKYIREQFEVWERRSREVWTLDISALGRYS